MIQARHIRVSGLVQGVGFRPFVWRLAKELDLAGWVRNDAAGVEIAVEGEADQLDALLRRLEGEAPAPARIDRVQAETVPAVGSCDFVIAESGAGKMATAIGHDTGLCGDCLRELFDPAGRRWRHAFITCTHCGPRYTLSRRLPYDRANTSLADFALCLDCANEYENPADRRFHAEPICCPQCGPQLQYLAADGEAQAGDPISNALAVLRAGGIVAIKGLGGFHLACDARNADAVAELRRRKNREEKPFAVMAANVASLAGYAVVDAEAATCLSATERPIVLLPKRKLELPGIAPGLQWLGALLPATPIQWLLLHEAAGRPAGTAWLDEPQDLLLVMTSANPGGEPLVIDNAEALQRLAGIADGYLLHDRAIVARCDDSVLRQSASGPAFIRRARGYTPTPIKLATSGPSVLALGAGLKNTVCFTRGDEAFVSAHIGDLDNATTVAFLDETVHHLQHILQVKPRVIACDLHPDFPSTRLAQALAEEWQMPLVPVQHHHAHIAAVAAEHGVVTPLLGLALDGIGHGSDGTAWGGELLRVDGAQYQRLGHLAPLQLPGGDRAAREPWRMAAAALHACGRGEEIPQRFAHQAAAATVEKMLVSGFNAPATSSAGRLFDAAAGLLGLRDVAAYEGQAAMLLEGLATTAGPVAPLADGWKLSNDGQLDLRPLLLSLMDEKEPAVGAARFHATLAAALAAWTLAAARREDLDTVALGGGCFLNQLLLDDLRQHLTVAGLTVLEAARVPPGDGGISLGQAWVALHTEC
jgi:hydrogenase maturation protein HypF